MDNKHIIDGSGPRSADVLVCGFSESPGSEFPPSRRSGVSGERRQLKLVESNGGKQKSTEANKGNEGRSLYSPFVHFVSHCYKYPQKNKEAQRKTKKHIKK
jgi:hypothetical protein